MCMCRERKRLCYIDIKYLWKRTPEVGNNDVGEAGNRVAGDWGDRIAVHYIPSSCIFYAMCMYYIFK